jgi:ribosome-binding protein aMBF1 (putative translation factor)
VRLRKVAKASITPAQCRAARQLLGWRQSELAAHVGVSERDIRDFESDDIRGMRIETEAIRQVLEAVGVEFIPESGGGAGVRLRKPRRG